MTNNIKILILLLFPTWIVAQNGYLVNQGATIVGLDNLYFSFDNVNIDNNGSMEMDSSVNTIIGSSSFDEIMLTGNNEINTGNTMVEADIDMRTNWEVEDFTLLDGVVFMSNSDILLGGSIYEERDESYITARDDSEIIKVIKTEPSTWYEPGNIGIGFTSPDFSSDEFIIRRGHVTFENEDKISISRHFVLSESIGKQDIDFSYLGHEAFEQNEDELGVFSRMENSSNSGWLRLRDQIYDTDNRKITATIPAPQNQFTLFNLIEENQPDVFIPQLLTLNDDGRNDVLLIEDLHKYPNNSVVIFNRWGDIIFRAAPYKNDWDGTPDRAFLKANDRKIVEGTYFIIFKPDENKDAFVKDYIEIIK